MNLQGGRYVVRGTLGEGSQGITYDATDTRDGRAVAIKRFDVRGARSWKDVELAEREVRVLSTLDHPLVPRYLDHFEEDGALYLVMEKIAGDDLDAILRRDGPLPEDEVRRFLACADRALTYLHGRGSPVVHRDIKPRNVVRRPDGTYVLVDFGTVSELVHRRGSSTIAGTIGYMAPEQLQGRATAATDVYAVGATALRALTGAEPETLPHRGLAVDVRAALGGRASPGMTAAIEQMLEPDPDRRPSELAGLLDGIRGSASAPPPETAAAPASTLRARRDAKRESRRAAAPRPARSREDTIVRSLRGLLWVMWGLGWVYVPLITNELGVTHLIPLIMFGALAAVIMVTWHKGALLRAAVRAIGAADANANANARDASELPTATEPAAGPRVEIGADKQVRVHTAELEPEEQTGGTEVQSSDAGPGRRARTR
jgi:hypothetical protein